ncbi:MAG: VanZ family protein [Oscillospiraceae bacterium]|nr:VanZ family protein [Oscillospiraceae bacterium]
MMKRRTVSGDPAYHENKLKMYREYDTVKSKKIQNNHKILCFWNVLVKAAFVFYLLCVLYLLFFERLIWQESSQFHKPFPADMSYQQAFRMSFQLKPFATIQYFRSWLQPDNLLFPIACKNLAGNLAMLFPMGIFLPYIFKKQRNPFWFCLTLTVMIGGAEMIQALTLLGKCDVDDYILNMLGALAGWLCFQVFCLLCFLWNFFRKRVIYARWN